MGFNSASKGMVRRHCTSMSIIHISQHAVYSRSNAILFYAECRTWCGLNATLTLNLRHIWSHWRNVIENRWSDKFSTRYHITIVVLKNTVIVSELQTCEGLDISRMWVTNFTFCLLHLRGMPIEILCSSSSLPSLPYDRSIVSWEATSPENVIQCFLCKFPVFPPFIDVIQ